MGHLLPRTAHVLRDDLPNFAEGLALDGTPLREIGQGRDGSNSPCLPVAYRGFDVVLRDAPTGPRAGHLREVNAEFPREPPRDRRRGNGVAIGCGDRRRGIDR